MTMKVKFRKFRQKLNIIAVTAFAIEKDKEQALFAGCTDYIYKPLNKNLLLEFVYKYIKIQLNPQHYV
jgi:CheY-like chemotaxis protein